MRVAFGRPGDHATARQVGVLFAGVTFLGLCRVGRDDLEIGGAEGQKCIACSETHVLSAVSGWYPEGVCCPFHAFVQGRHGVHEAIDQRGQDVSPLF